VVSRIPENPTQQLKAVLQAAMPGKAIRQPYAKPPNWIVVLILLPFVLPLVLGVLAIVGGLIFALIARRAMNSGPGQSGLPVGTSLQWSGSDAAMLFDVNGDGIADPIGFVRLLGSESQTQHIGAFDAVTGQRLWLSKTIGDLSSSHQMTAALVQDTVLYVDPTGMLRTLSPASGQILWSAPLPERVERICAVSQGLASILLADKRLFHVQLGSGQLSHVHQGENTQPCKGVWSTQAGLTPLFHMEDWRSRGRSSMPEVPGMRVEKLLRDGTSDATIALGYKTPGSRIPAAASIIERTALEQGSGKLRRTPQGNSRVETRWLVNVPSNNPLSVQEGEPSTGAISSGRLIVPYERSGAKNSGRLACLDLATGSSLWDVEIPQSDTGDVSAIVANDLLIFVSIWTYLHIFDLATGVHRSTIGKWH
jgi:hypothetical protein